MPIIQHEPLKFLSRMQSDLNDFFNLNGKRMVPHLFVEPEKSAVSDWLPSVDVKENSKQIVITVDVPGVNPDDIQVSVDNGYLSIRGERKSAREEQADNHRVRECSYGLFERHFSLPSSADSESITAKQKHGALTVTIVKKKGAKPREVDIKS